MKQVFAVFLFMLALQPLAFAQNRLPEIRENIPLDSIRLSDPCILADSETF